MRLWLGLPVASALPRAHLCVFIPISERSRKDGALSLAALGTWAQEQLQRDAGAKVRFVSVGSTAGSPLEPYTLHVPGDEEVGYKRLPVRILKIWHYLGQEDDCDWVMKADSDTYVNLPLGKVAHGRGEGTGIESHEALVFPCMAFFFFSFFL
ncbi:unnamed protein product, partial [Effrenium voratum]